MKKYNRKKMFYLIGIVSLIVILFGGIFLWDYYRTYTWIANDAGTLEPYNHVLFDEGHPMDLLQVPDPELGVSSDLVRQDIQKRQLLIKHLSIGNPHVNLWKTKVYIKAFLVTKVAGSEEEATRQVRVLYVFYRDKEKHWQILRTEDLTIP